MDVGEVTLADMSPDDIRAELKRLYLQLELFKSRTIIKDNPHISKRRGGRKAQHRRFSLQVSFFEPFEQESILYLQLNVITKIILNIGVSHINELNFGDNYFTELCATVFNVFKYV